MRYEQPGWSPKMSDAADEVKDLIEKSRRLLDQAREFAARYEQLTSELREILAKLERQRKKM